MAAALPTALVGYFFWFAKEFILTTFYHPVLSLTPSAGALPIGLLYSPTYSRLHSKVPLFYFTVYSLAVGSILKSCGPDREHIGPLHAHIGRSKIENADGASCKGYPVKIDEQSPLSMLQ